MRQLKSIKRKKATGLDNLPAGLLKNSAEQISAPLTYLINLSLTTGVFPTDWKAAKVMPLHKSVPFSNFDNYRPISILPVLSKIIEKIIHHQVMLFLNENHLLLQSQSGFRPNLSTEYAATILLDDVRKMLVKNVRLKTDTFLNLIYFYYCQKLSFVGSCDSQTVMEVNFYLQIAITRQIAEYK